MQILFYDIATPLAYTQTTLEQQGLGGTEATIIRIAHALKNYHQVYIAQHCRTSHNNQISDDVNYISLESAHTLTPDVVVLLRHYRQADEVGQRYPHARKFLWLHNMPARELYAAHSALHKHQFEIIAVSHFHQMAISRRLHGKWYQRFSKKQPSIPVHVLYNPIDNNLIPDNTPWDPTQLLFMSSPQKGLTATLKDFAKVRAHFPEYQLLIANPGYNHAKISLPEQARFLGVLPHYQVIQQLRNSFCVFYPQHEREETFGLIYAEANAVGTPVLAHDFGAAKEVLSDPQQLVNGCHLQAILEKLTHWRTNRPIVHGKDEFRLSNVSNNWLDLLNI